MSQYFTKQESLEKENLSQENQKPWSPSLKFTIVDNTKSNSVSPFKKL